jgi:ribosomal protein S12 methylthiotransferase
MSFKSGTVCVVSLGCPKNLVDSEHILGVLARAGWRISARTELADTVIINTCGFLQSARDEAHATIRGMLEQRSPNQRVIVAGCLVQQDLPGLRRRFPEVERFIGIDDIPDLPRVLASHQPPAFSHQPPATMRFGAALPRLVATPGHYAYLRIADGCDNCCAYCLIPSIRGRLRSRPMNDVVREAGMLARNGVRELILIAQDTTIYGQDIEGRKLLAPLVRRLNRIPGIEWLRLLYTHPAHFTPELLFELAENDKLVKYVDLPLQHVSDRLLRRMNRGYTRTEVESLLQRLLVIPGMAIRTTFITGLPGETQAEFNELLDFVGQGHFAHVGCFAYSPEPGTRAARMPGQIAPAISEQRARQVMAAQRRVALRRNRQMTGQRIQVRIDSFDPARREYLGRTSADAPEIDDTVHVSATSHHDVRIGELVDAKVTRAGAYDLWATSA